MPGVHAIIVMRVKKSNTKVDIPINAALKCSAQKTAQVVYVAKIVERSHQCRKSQSSRR